MNQIVVSVRMSHAGLAEGTGRAYLERARALTAHAEALGATLVAWSATTFAMAWDDVSSEEAIAFCVALGEQGAHAASHEQAWACGVAEGEMELLAPAGQRAELAWGPALVSAISLARIAKPGEVLLDGDVRALRVGELNGAGTRVATDGGKRVRGVRLDLARPWRGPTSSRAPRSRAPSGPRSAQPVPIDADSTSRVFIAPHDGPDATIEALESTDERPLPSFPLEVLELAETAGDIERPTIPMAPRAGPAAVHEVPEVIFSPPPAAKAPVVVVSEDGAPPPPMAMRPAANGLDGRAAAVDALIALRRARARAEASPAAARCHASLALAVGLLRADRADEALLEGLDALARAREAAEPKGVDACLAFLAKLYASVGLGDVAASLWQRA